MKRAVCLVVLFACKAQPTSFPDAPKVEDAQTKWCAVMEKHAKDDLYAYNAKCLTAAPTSSAAFLARMADCVDGHLEGLGDQAPDFGALIQNCTEEVLYSSDPGDVSNSPAIKARCQRMERCEKVEPSECLSAIGSLDGAQRSSLSAMYNLHAQAKIGDCLRESDCTKDEDSARDACFAPQRAKRVWMPF